MIKDDGSLKLIDFGLSKASRKKKLTEKTGTPFYMAPEVLKGNYHAPSDIWSTGVLLYFLISGYRPFEGKSCEEVFNKIKNLKKPDFNEEFISVSEECKDLITQLLNPNPKTRITGLQALEHPWFKT